MINYYGKSWSLRVIFVCFGGREVELMGLIFWGVVGGGEGREEK